MNFPLLTSTIINAERLHQFETNVSIIEAAVEAGSIRNVVYSDTKDSLSNVVYKAWSNLIQDQYVAGYYRMLRLDERDLYDNVKVFGLHDVISAAKKVAKSKVQSPLANAMREFCAEVLPLAEAVKSLKDKIIKGRIPSLIVKEVNPNKDVKTCPCCFRPIAVVNGTMVHHGYKRPGDGWQSASCPAAKRFEPLEISSRGLIWLIGVVTDRLVGTQATYDAREENNVLIKKSPLKNKPIVTIKRGEDGWDKEYKLWTSQLLREIESLNREISYLNKVLKEWDDKRVVHKPN